MKTPVEVKKILIDISKNVEPFKLTYSDTKSKKVLGYYNYRNKSITLHSGLLKDDNELLKTAIHELAHHIDFTMYGVPKKPHTGNFKYVLNILETRAKHFGYIQDNKSEELDAVYQAAVDLGFALKKMIESGKHSDVADDFEKKLQFIKKSQIKHFLKLAAYSKRKVK